MGSLSWMIVFVLLYSYVFDIKKYILALLSVMDYMFILLCRFWLKIWKEYIILCSVFIFLFFCTLFNSIQPNCYYFVFYLTTIHAIVPGYLILMARLKKYNFSCYIFYGINNHIFRNRIHYCCVFLDCVEYHLSESKEADRKMERGNLIVLKKVLNCN